MPRRRTISVKVGDQAMFFIEVESSHHGWTIRPHSGGGKSLYGYPPKTVDTPAEATAQVKKFLSSIVGELLFK